MFISPVLWGLQLTTRVSKGLEEEAGFLLDALLNAALAQAEVPQRGDGEVPELLAALPVAEGNTWGGRVGMVSEQRGVESEGGDRERARAREQVQSEKCRKKSRPSWKKIKKKRGNIDVEKREKEGRRRGSEICGDLGGGSIN